MILAWLRSMFSNVECDPVTGHDDSEELSIDAEGWLHGASVVRYPSVRSSRLAVDEPIAIVWHYTATDYGTAESMAKRIRKFRAGRDRAASWHLCVAEDGTIYQSVPFLRGAWHCKAGRVEGWKPNACSIGIEIEGHGETDRPAQVAAVVKLAKLLAAEYHIPPRRATLEHSELDPQRRNDPGPKWRRIVVDAVQGVLPSRGRR